MTPFEAALEFTLSREGGYSADPQDPGGETNLGISKRSYPDEDILNMTRARAAFIYERDFWTPAGCAKFPLPIAILLFDGAVNQGPGKCVRLLQEALGVTVDGVVGPKTVAAVTRLGINAAVSRFVGKRAFHYAGTKNFERFGFGWLRRLSACQIAATSAKF